MRNFKTKWFARFVRREKIMDANLQDAIRRAERGLIKQRVAKPGAGRSGGYRMIVAYRSGDRAVFLYAFATSERENIDPDELEDLRAIGQRWLSLPVEPLGVEVAEGRLQEVIADEEER